jgi:hypothetical protein
MFKPACLVLVASVSAQALFAPEAGAQCDNAVAVSPPTLSNIGWGKVGQPFTSSSFSASGVASGMYFWNGPTSSAAMHGLYLSTVGSGGATDAIIGTPDASGAGQFNVGMSVTDWTTALQGQCLPTSFSYTVDICSAAVTLSPAGGTLPAGTVGVPYSTALGVTGGTNGVYWNDMGSVPGLALFASGLATNAAANTLGGTPTTAGTFTETIAIADWPNWTQTSPVITQCAATTYAFSVTIAGAEPDSGANDSGPAEPDAGEDAAPDAGACMQIGGDCSSAEACCGSLECGTVEGRCCIAANQQCTSPSDCCQLSGGQVGITCSSNGICETVDMTPEAGCSNAGESCAIGSCCAGLVCGKGMLCALPQGNGTGTKPGNHCSVTAAGADGEGGASVGVLGVFAALGAGMARRAHRTSRARRRGSPPRPA